MKTIPLFWQDCYLKEFDATVVAAGGNKVQLDRSTFSYSGGGHLGDTGKLESEKESFAVTDTVKENGELWHVVANDGLAAGDKVRGMIDWERRYAVMRYHTATHVLAAVMHRDAGALITGNQLYTDRGRIDFSLESMDREKIAEYVSTANEALQRGMDVKMHSMPREQALQQEGMVKLANSLPPEEKELNIVEIGDIDRQADGGAHVKNTKECGTIEILKLENKGKGRKRIYFRLV